MEPKVSHMMNLSINTYNMRQKYIWPTIWVPHFSLLQINHSIIGNRGKMLIKSAKQKAIYICVSNDSKHVFGDWKFYLSGNCYAEASCRHTPCTLLCQPKKPPDLAFSLILLVTASTLNKLMGQLVSLQWMFHTPMGRLVWTANTLLTCQSPS